MLIGIYGDKYDKIEIVSEFQPLCLKHSQQLLNGGAALHCTAFTHANRQAPNRELPG
jgi:hypothetical protein